MSNDVANIKAALIAAIGTLFPSKTASKYGIDPTRNAEGQNANIFAVRPGAAIFAAEQTTRRITVDQTFEVEFIDKFIDSAGADTAAQAKILSLFADVTTLVNTALRRKLSVASVLLFSDFETDDPVVNNDNLFVSITTRFTVKYRMEA